MNSHSYFGADVIAKLPASIVDGFASAFAEALRVGVRVERLDGLHGWSNAGRMVVTDAVDSTRKVLEKEAADLKRAISNYERRVALADPPELGDAWAAKAEEARQKLTSVENELADLEAESQSPSAPPAPDEFESEVGFLLTAARALSCNKGSMPRDMVHRIATVMPERIVRVLPDSRVQVEVYVRLPMDGGVGRVGPITWIPDDQPDLSVGLIWAAREEADEPAPWLEQRQPPPQPLPHGRSQVGGNGRGPVDQRSRRRAERQVLLHQLEEAGASRSKALTLVACPFPAAVPVVLAHAAGEPAPDWVGEQWADPNWMAWLHDCYVRTSVARGVPDKEVSNGVKSGLWAAPAWTRQALLDTVSESGGRLSYLTLLRRVAENGISRLALARMLREGGPSQTGSERPWPEPLARWGNWPSKGQGTNDHDYGVELFRCSRCDDAVAIDLAVRVHEIPGDLLCPRGHMVNTSASVAFMFPDADTDVGAGGNPATSDIVIPDTKLVTVPAEYQWLRAAPRTYQWRRPIHSAPVSVIRDDVSKPTRVRSRYLAPSRLTGTQRAAAISRYVDDLVPAARVAEEFGLSTSGMTRLLREEGVMRAYRPRKKKQSD